ncbi:uncharacterized protein LOC135378287 isoform X2 [Ornithodoros turicata]|uniref:uncharacterized protein LOC135378287 isoform X2 n=1 Tax=Ornithodoros turicata TaxID=34597 RepID=UPI00313A39C8
MIGAARLVLLAITLCVSTDGLKTTPRVFINRSESGCLFSLFVKIGGLDGSLGVQDMWKSIYLPIFRNMHKFCTKEDDFIGCVATRKFTDYIHCMRDYVSSSTIHNNTGIGPAYKSMLNDYATCLGKKIDDYY